MERRVVFGHRWLPLALIAPQLAITAVFFFWPAYETVVSAFYAQGAFGGGEHFVGLANFVALWHDTNYLHSFWVTLVFSAATTALSLSVSLLLAVNAQRALAGGRIYRALLTWPYAVAPAIAGVLWLFLFNPGVGLLADALSVFGVAWNFHIHGGQAMILVVIASAWRQIAYNFLFFLAALYSMPGSLIEAAAIDGAGPSRRFWTIIFPLLSPTTFFLLVIDLVYAFFETFGVIDTVTHGGPANATNILVYEVFQTGMQGMDIGGAAAQSVVLMLFIIGLTVLQFRFIEGRVRY
ncbi:sn-glycerol-3-phosphate ABC transporter permease UgpA [Salinisphaera sp. RV14]|uniref:sn-glycerol-3-phosphate ABC transporter permease UgpA n=1 Tax=unclassified Salinisphaera TaxID=2649847 RepID=UPI003F8506E5